jgi:hypothetical protein
MGTQLRYNNDDVEGHSKPIDTLPHLPVELWAEIISYLPRYILKSLLIFQPHLAKSRPTFTSPRYPSTWASFVTSGGTWTCTEVIGKATMNL